MNNHVCIDLETLSTSNNALITSLAAVQFNLETGEIGRQFKMNIDVEDAQANGLEISASTIKWWLTQKPETCAKMFTEAENISVVLTDFKMWLEGVEDVKVWGNSARFNLGILENAFLKVMYEPAPWKFRNEYCYRTLKNLFPNVSLPEANGEHHEPLSDGLYQIKHLCAIYKHIGNDSQYKDSEFESNYGAALILLDDVVANQGRLSEEGLGKIRSFMDGDVGKKVFLQVKDQLTEAKQILDQLLANDAPACARIRKLAENFLGYQKPIYKFENPSHGFTEGVDLN